jgi:hypothetical protein
MASHPLMKQGIMCEVHGCLSCVYLSKSMFQQNHAELLRIILCNTQKGIRKRQGKVLNKDQVSVRGKKIPDWAVVRKFIQNLQLFQGDLIDLVHNIDARHIYPTSLNDIYEVISSCIKPKSNISIVNSVFTTYCLHSFKV